MRGFALRRIAKGLKAVRQQSNNGRTSNQTAPQKRLRNTARMQHTTSFCVAFAYKANHRYTSWVLVLYSPKLEKITALCKNFLQLNTSVL